MGFIISLQREIFSYCKNSTVCVDGHFSRSKVDVSAEQVTTKMNIKMQWNLIKDLALETLKYLHVLFFRSGFSNEWFMSSPLQRLSISSSCRKFNHRHERLFFFYECFLQKIQNLT